ncbi:hypothetical protein F4814DRAFT_419471 [Daldinia grandis]|nr:hypothetical protein F4814DRAFT_419471 [Daldinia grandis]
MDIPAQPDFPTIASNYAGLSREFSRCINLPAVNEGNQILSVLRDIQSAVSRLEARMVKIETRMEKIETRMERIETQFHELGIQMKAMDSNNISRLINSKGENQKAELQPFHAVSTGEQIENFPATVGDIQDLSNAELSRILLLLNQPSTGTQQVKRKRLALTIGVTAWVIVR